LFLRVCLSDLVSFDGPVVSDVYLCPVFFFAGIDGDVDESGLILLATLVTAGSFEVSMSAGVVHPLCELLSRDEAVAVGEIV
jgi:hypothetical protein